MGSIAHDANIEWPVKTSELQNHHLDTRVWNDFTFRSDDIVIATWAKCGTTWMQQIILQLVFDGAEGIPVGEKSPWMDLRVNDHEATRASLEAQTHRRFIKTHAPLETLVYSPKAKYIFVARDGRDVIWSLHNHMYKATPLFYHLMNDTPGRVGPALERPPADPREYFLDFLEDETRNSIPFPFWKHQRDWLAIRHLPNILIVHYNDLKADLSGEIARIAQFLDIELTEEKRAKVVEHCTFDYMKEHAMQMTHPLANDVWEGGAATFMNKGTNGRWSDSLTADDVKRYEAKAVEELGEEDARWLANGRQAS